MNSGDLITGKFQRIRYFGLRINTVLSNDCPDSCSSLVPASSSKLARTLWRQ